MRILYCADDEMRSFGVESETSVRRKTKLRWPRIDLSSFARSAMSTSLTGKLPVPQLPPVHRADGLVVDGDAGSGGVGPAHFADFETAVLAKGAGERGMF